MLHALCGILKVRVDPPASCGPPKAPVALRVSAIRQGVTGMNCKALVVVVAAPFTGTITPNQEVFPPVHVDVAVWIPALVAAFASETIPGVTAGATVIPVYPVPGLAVNLQQETSVTANIRSLAFTVGPLVVMVA